MSRKSERKKERSENVMLFGRKNYQWATAGCLLVFIGFLLMYLENEVYGWISLNLSPVMILSGYGAILYAIVKRFEARTSGDNDNAKSKGSTVENG